MKTLVNLLVLLLLFGCQTPAKKPEPAKLPRVLLIGDSISQGYTPTVKRLLKGEALVIHNRGNAQHSGVGLKCLQEWLGQEEWDLIHFNWGLWDLCYRHPESKVQGRRDKVRGTLTISLVQYEKNLRLLVKQLKATGSRLIWASTTPVPAGEAGRHQGDACRYNLVARRIMEAEGVTINDLHQAIFLEVDKYYVAPGNVHFNRDGYQFLGEKVVQSIRESLSQ